MIGLLYVHFQEQLVEKKRVIQEKDSTRQTVPEHEDLEGFVHVVGVSQRSKLSRVIGKTATSVEGSKFHYPASQYGGSQDVQNAEIMSSVYE